LGRDGTIHLGIVAPMSGPNSRYGSFSLRGAQLAAEEINDAGGVGGHKITVIPADSQGTPVEGVSATRRLIDLDKADFIIGDVSSSVTLAMQPVVEDAGVLLLNAASSNPKITYGAGVGGFKWTFRTTPPMRTAHSSSSNMPLRREALRSLPFFPSTPITVARRSSSRSSNRVYVLSGPQDSCAPAVLGRARLSSDPLGIPAARRPLRRDGGARVIHQGYHSLGWKLADWLERRHKCGVLRRVAFASAEKLPIHQHDHDETRL
jgi:Periplasmic binding protein